MADRGGKVRWSVERRLEFIEFRLFWEGRINRADLVRFFGVSVPQASVDLNRYLKIAPHNLIYDKTTKAYLATRRFRPKLSKPFAEHYLAQLRLVAADILSESESWLGRIPSFDVLPTPRRQLHVDHLKRVLEAIRGHSAIHLKYQSFSKPHATWRWITPHALGFDGFRWHARAWCHERDDFRDFVLARISSIGDMRPSPMDFQADAEWQREVKLRLGPHPAMEPGMRRAIEHDYGMTDGVVEIRTRVCLSYYLERQLGLDLDPRLIPAARQQLVLVNREEVEAARRDARLESSGRPRRSA